MNLDFKNLAVASCVCRAWKYSATSDSIWKILCQNDWATDAVSNGTQRLKGEEAASSFREVYSLYFNSKLRQYLPVYGRVRRAMASLCQITDALRLDCKLNPGAYDMYIDNMEIQTGTKLDLETRCVYRLVGGQSYDATHGVFGGYMYYGVGANVFFVDTNRIPKLHPAVQQLTNTWSNKLEGMPIALDMESRKKVYLYVKSSNHGHAVGSIVELSQSRKYITIAPSLLELLKRTDYNLRIGNWRPDEKIIPVFSSLLSHGATEAVTRGVRVQCSVVFVPEECGTPEMPHFFTYRITLSMDKSESPSKKCRLVSRHWISTSYEGEVSHTGGPGVIGAFPVVEPGSKFEYTSCSHQQCFGSMEGTFTMQNLITNEQFEVTVPRFFMQAAEELLDRDIMTRNHENYVKMRQRIEQ